MRSGLLRSGFFYPGLRCAGSALNSGGLCACPNRCATAPLRSFERGGCSIGEGGGEVLFRVSWKTLMVRLVLLVVFSACLDAAKADV